MSRRIAAVGIGVLLAGAPAGALASGLEARLGGFFPRAQANLFDDTRELFGVQRGDWAGWSGGVEYSLGIARHFELGFHIDGYGRELRTSYEDFPRVRQRLRLNIVPVGASVRWLPARPRARVAPYLTVGGDIIGYEYEEWGEFVDFFADNRVGVDSFQSTGATVGYHVAAGLRVPVSHDFSATAEVRYQGSRRPRMDDDFDRNNIDLSGLTTTLGFRVRF